MRKTFKLLFYIITGAITYSIGFTVYENIKFDQMIASFVARGIKEGDLIATGSTGNNYRQYYYVPRETNEGTESVFYDYNKGILGAVGDVFVNKDSPFPNVPFIHQFITFYYGGHSTIFDENNRISQAVGFPDDTLTIWDAILHESIETDDCYSNPDDYSSVVVSNNVFNYWLASDYYYKDDPFYQYYNGYYRDEVVGLRINTSKEIRQRASNLAKSRADKNAMYNFLFFMDMENKFYCTDLVSRSYSEIEYCKDEIPINLNSDNFITSVNDLALSPDVFMSLYVKIAKDEMGRIIEHVYYLEELS